MGSRKSTRQERRDQRYARLREAARLESLKKLDSPARRTLNLAFHAVAAFVVAAFVPMFPMILPLAWLLFLFMFITQPTREVVGRRVLAMLWLVFVMPWLLAGLVVVHRAFAVVVYRIVDPSWATPELRALFIATPLDLVVAASGIVLAFVVGLYAQRVLRLQLAQVHNLATGHAGSAAIGLAEFRGTAHPAPGALRNTLEHSDGAIFPPEDILYYRRDWMGDRIRERKRWSRFYLEDGSGRILVEPQGAEFWDGKVSWLFEPMRKIRLTRCERSFLNPEPEERSFLRKGDPVHVIGSVEVNADAPPNAVDSARLILRPSSERMKTTWIERILFPSFIGQGFRKGRDCPHVFFLTDANEIDLQSLLEEALRRSLIASLFWLGASLWLLVEVNRSAASLWSGS